MDDATAAIAHELMMLVVDDDRSQQSATRLQIECLDPHDEPETPEPEDMARLLRAIATTA